MSRRMKSIFRMLTWDKGPLRSRSRRRARVPERDHVSVQEILMEGLRQLDEFNAIRDEPSRSRGASDHRSPLIPPLRDLKPEELDVLQLAHNYGHLETVLNKSLATDLETAQIVLKLVEKNYLRVG